MAKLKKEEEVAVATSEQQGVSILNIEALKSKLKTGKQSGINISAEFHDWEDGVEERLAVIGTRMVDDLKGTGEKKQAILFLDENGVCTVSADVVLCTTLGDIADKVQKGEIDPVNYFITCTGEEQSGNNKSWSYKTFIVMPMIN